MATKTICDGCGVDVNWSDGRRRAVTLCTGLNHQEWDLCDPCQNKIANALVDLLPGTPREGWWATIRQAKST